MLLLGAERKTSARSEHFAFCDPDRKSRHAAMMDF
jgi:hypothetical protein